MWELDHNEGREPKDSWDCKEIKPVNPKGNQPGILAGRTDAEAEAPILWLPDTEPTFWKRPCFWERLKAEGEEGDRGWGGWMAPPIQRTWTWANSRRWWGTGRPSVLQSMESKRVRYDLATECLSLHPLSSQAGGPEASSSPCCSCGLSQVPRASSKVSGSPECESNTCCLHNTAQIAGPSLLLGLTQRKLRPVPTRAGSSGTGPRDQQGTFLGV